ncbi:hypothetical protein NDU88_004582 [Pleurodeles waltl]|uniref:Uncharacterized protein n=1 Tax=Pleurodeles waltl TaxID=8319 RepID=A0AAV7L1E0_PLEWA|nr:hypothetical protein NDU88_004582 [Pleurodeles waltl]
MRGGVHHIAQERIHRGDDAYLIINQLPEADLFCDDQNRHQRMGVPGLYVDGAADSLELKKLKLAMCILSKD